MSQKQLAQSMRFVNQGRRLAVGVLGVIGLLVAATAGRAEIVPAGLGGGQRGEGVPKFYIRDGYRVEVAAEGFGEARFMEFDDNGNLFVSQPTKGNITIMHKGADGKYKAAGTLVTGLKTAHGMYFYKGWLWFTQSQAVYKIKLKSDGTADGEKVTVIPDGQLPSGGHWWRSILVTDEGFYTSIGDPGNITDVDGGNTAALVDKINASSEGGGLSPTTIPAALSSKHIEDREKIWFYSLDGSKRTLFVAGIRNTEKLRFRPGTTEVWGCDHGSDNFGKVYGETEKNQPITDVFPPEKIFHYEQGKFYGHPFIIGNRIPRPEFAKRPDILELANKTTPAQWQLGAHWAINAFTFVNKDYFPGLKGDMLVACHGSWNSTTKVGYGIERITFDQASGNPYGSMRIVTTLEAGSATGKVLARPVDLLEEASGTMLFSDDQGNKIYRLTKAQ